MKNIIRISMKILVTLIFFIMIFYTFNNSFVYARLAEGTTADDGFRTEDGEVAGDTNSKKNNGEEFNPNFWQPVTVSTPGEDKLLSISKRIIGPVQIIGSLISVIAIILIGIKYMLGSVQEKAQYKETLVPYFLGAVFVFGIFTILPIIYNLAIKIGTK